MAKACDACGKRVDGRALKDGVCRECRDSGSAPGAASFENQLAEVKRLREKKVALERELEQLGDDLRAACKALADASDE